MSTANILEGIYYTVEIITSHRKENCCFGYCPVELCVCIFFFYTRSQCLGDFILHQICDNLFYSQCQHLFKRKNEEQKSQKVDCGATENMGQPTVNNNFNNI